MVIQHGDLVGENQIGLQSLHTAEVSAVKGEKTEGFVDGGGRLTGGLLHAPCGTSGGGTADNAVLRMLALVDVEDSPLDHGFAGTGAAGDDAERVGERHLDGFPLLRRKANAKGALLGVNLLIQIFILILARRLEQAVNVICKGSLTLGVGHPVDHPLIRDKIALGYKTRGAVCEHLFSELRRLQKF